MTIATNSRAFRSEQHGFSLKKKEGLARARAAYTKARDDLLRERNHLGHWVGELASSALATATAISALSIYEKNSRPSKRHDEIRTQIELGIEHLATQQNADGGWGDTDKSYSNISTSTLVIAAFHLSGRDQRFAQVVDKGKNYLDKFGGAKKIKARYGKDKTFAVPILANAALAGLVEWREVGVLPFEAAVIPQKFYHLLQLPVVSYAIPALVAIGQAKFFFDRPKNPLTRLIRKMSIGRSLKVLLRMQPESGGYLEAIPLTSFVVMSLAATDRQDHPVVKKGIEFILESFRDDGSWPIDTNLATWNTTLSINALAASGEDVSKLKCWDWLLACQYDQQHPFTGAKPGAWGWSDLSGAVPDADDTPGAIVSLRHLVEHAGPESPVVGRAKQAIEQGQTWLTRLQNRDGGWPTFCKGWGRLPFDRSGTDLTAHALRALNGSAAANDRIIERGFSFLARQQREDGSWIPLWFGNQDNRLPIPDDQANERDTQHKQHKKNINPDNQASENYAQRNVQLGATNEENPVYGTAKVLLAYQELGRNDTQEALHGLNWLLSNQNSDGGWGGGKSARGELTSPGAQKYSSIEESALAIEALAGFLDPGCQAGLDSDRLFDGLNRGIQFLIESIESNEHCRSWPIGFYFAKLWYYEKLYPIIFVTAALGRTLVQIESPMERNGIAKQEAKTTSTT